MCTLQFQNLSANNTTTAKTGKMTTDLATKLTKLKKKCELSTVLPDQNDIKEDVVRVSKHLEQVEIEMRSNASVQESAREYLKMYNKDFDQNEVPTSPFTEIRTSCPKNCTLDELVKGSFFKNTEGQLIVSPAHLKYRAMLIAFIEYFMHIGKNPDSGEYLNSSQREVLFDLIFAVLYTVPAEYATTKASRLCDGALDCVYLAGLDPKVTSRVLHTCMTVIKLLNQADWRPVIQGEVISRHLLLPTNLRGIRHAAVRCSAFLLCFHDTVAEHPECAALVSVTDLLKASNYEIISLFRDSVAESKNCVCDNTLKQNHKHLCKHNVPVQPETVLKVVWNVFGKSFGPDTNDLPQELQQKLEDICDSRFKCACEQLQRQMMCKLKKQETSDFIHNVNHNTNFGVPVPNPLETTATRIPIDMCGLHSNSLDLLILASRSNFRSNSVLIALEQVCTADFFQTASLATCVDTLRQCAVYLSFHLDVVPQQLSVKQVFEIMCVGLMSYGLIDNCVSKAWDEMRKLIESRDDMQSETEDMHFMLDLPDEDARNSGCIKHTICLNQEQINQADKQIEEQRSCLQEDRNEGLGAPFSKTYASLDLVVACYLCSHAADLFAPNTSHLWIAICEDLNVGKLFELLDTQRANSGAKIDYRDDTLVSLILQLLRVAFGIQSDTKELPHEAIVQTFGLAMLESASPEVNIVKLQNLAHADNCQLFVLNLFKELAKHTLHKFFIKSIKSFVPSTMTFTTYSRNTRFHNLLGFARGSVYAMNSAEKNAYAASLKRVFKRNDLDDLCTLYHTETGQLQPDISYELVLIEEEIFATFELLKTVDRLVAKKNYTALLTLIMHLSFSDLQLLLGQTYNRKFLQEYFTTRSNMECMFDFITALGNSTCMDNTDDAILCDHKFKALTENMNLPALRALLTNAMYHSCTMSVREKLSLDAGAHERSLMMNTSMWFFGVLNTSAMGNDFKPKLTLTLRDISSRMQCAYPKALLHALRKEICTKFTKAVTGKMLDLLSDSREIQKMIVIAAQETQGQIAQDTTPLNNHNTASVSSVSRKNIEECMPFVVSHIITLTIPPTRSPRTKKQMKRNAHQKCEKVKNRHVAILYAAGIARLLEVLDAMDKNLHLEDINTLSCRFNALASESARNLHDVWDANTGTTMQMLKNMSLACKSMLCMIKESIRDTYKDVPSCPTSMPETSQLQQMLGVQVDAEPFSKQYEEIVNCLIAPRCVSSANSSSTIQKHSFVRFKEGSLIGFNSSDLTHGTPQTTGSGFCPLSSKTQKCKFCVVEIHDCYEGRQVGPLKGPPVPGMMYAIFAQVVPNDPIYVKVTKIHNDGKCDVVLQQANNKKCCIHTAYEGTKLTVEQDRLHVINAQNSKTSLHTTGSKLKLIQQINDSSVEQYLIVTAQTNCAFALKTNEQENLLCLYKVGDVHDAAPLPPDARVWVEIINNTTAKCVYTDSETQNRYTGFIDVKYLTPAPIVLWDVDSTCVEEASDDTDDMRLGLTGSLALAMRRVNNCICPESGVTENRLKHYMILCQQLHDHCSDLLPLLSGFNNTILVHNSGFSRNVVQLFWQLFENTNLVEDEIFVFIKDIKKSVEILEKISSMLLHPQGPLLQVIHIATKLQDIYIATTLQNTQQDAANRIMPLKALERFYNHFSWFAKLFPTMTDWIGASLELHEETLGMNSSVTRLPEAAEFKKIRDSGEFSRLCDSASKYMEVLLDQMLFDEMFAYVQTHAYFGIVDNISTQEEQYAETVQTILMPEQLWLEDQKPHHTETKLSNLKVSAPAQRKLQQSVQPALQLAAVVFSETNKSLKVLAYEIGCILQSVQHSTFKIQNQLKELLKSAASNFTGLDTLLQKMNERSQQQVSNAHGACSKVAYSNARAAIQSAGILPNAFELIGIVSTLYGMTTIDVSKINQLHKVEATEENRGAFRNTYTRKTTCMPNKQNLSPAAYKHMVNHHALDTSRKCISAAQRILLDDGSTLSEDDAHMLQEVVNSYTLFLEDMETMESMYSKMQSLLHCAHELSELQNDVDNMQCEQRKASAIARKFTYDCEPHLQQRNTPESSVKLNPRCRNTGIRFIGPTAFGHLGKPSFVPTVSRLSAQTLQGSPLAQPINTKWLCTHPEQSAIQRANELQQKLLSGLERNAFMTVITGDHSVHEKFVQVFELLENCPFHVPTLDVVNAVYNKFVISMQWFDSAIILKQIQFEFERYKQNLLILSQYSSKNVAPDWRRFSEYVCPSNQLDIDSQIKTLKWHLLLKTISNLMCMYDGLALPPEVYSHVRTTFEFTDSSCPSPFLTFYANPDTAFAEFTLLDSLYKQLAALLPDLVFDSSQHAELSDLYGKTIMNALNLFVDAYGLALYGRVVQQRVEHVSSARSKYEQSQGMVAPGVVFGVQNDRECTDYYMSHYTITCISASTKVSELLGVLQTHMVQLDTPCTQLQLVGKDQVLPLDESLEALGMVSSNGTFEHMQLIGDTTGIVTIQVNPTALQCTVDEHKAVHVSVSKQRDVAEFLKLSNTARVRVQLNCADGRSYATNVELGTVLRSLETGGNILGLTPDLSHTCKSSCVYITMEAPNGHWLRSNNKTSHHIPQALTNQAEKIVHRIHLAQSVDEHLSDAGAILWTYVSKLLKLMTCGPDNKCVSTAHVTEVLQTSPHPYPVYCRALETIDLRLFAKIDGVMPQSASDRRNEDECAFAAIRRGLTSYEELCRFWAAHSLETVDAEPAALSSMSRCLDNLAKSNLHSKNLYPQERINIAKTNLNACKVSFVHVNAVQGLCTELYHHLCALCEEPIEPTDSPPVDTAADFDSDLFSISFSQFSQDEAPLDVGQTIDMPSTKYTVCCIIQDLMTLSEWYKTQWRVSLYMRPVTGSLNTAVVQTTADLFCAMFDPNDGSQMLDASEPKDASSVIKHAFEICEDPKQYGIKQQVNTFIEMCDVVELIMCIRHSYSREMTADQLDDLQTIYSVSFDITNRLMQICQQVVETTLVLLRLQMDTLCDRLRTTYSSNGALCKAAESVVNALSGSEFCFSGFASDALIMPDALRSVHAQYTCPLPSKTVNESGKLAICRHKSLTLTEFLEHLRSGGNCMGTALYRHEYDKHPDSVPEKDGVLSEQQVKDLSDPKAQFLVLPVIQAPNNTLSALTFQLPNNPDQPLALRYLQAMAKCTVHNAHEVVCFEAMGNESAQLSRILGIFKHGSNRFTNVTSDPNSMTYEQLMKRHFGSAPLRISARSPVLAALYYNTMPNTELFRKAIEQFMRAVNEQYTKSAGSKRKRGRGHDLHGHWEFDKDNQWHFDGM